MIKWLEESSNVYAEKHTNTHFCEERTRTTECQRCACVNTSSGFYEVCICKASDGRAGGDGGVVSMFGSQWSSFPVRRNVVPVSNERLKTNYREQKSEYFCMSVTLTLSSGESHACLKTGDMNSSFQSFHYGNFNDIRKKKGGKNKQNICIFC